MNSLKEKYIKEVVPNLLKKHNYKSIMEVPKLEKIVINVGLGEATKNSKLLDVAVKELELITDSKPIITKAKSYLCLWFKKGCTNWLQSNLKGEKCMYF